MSGSADGTTSITEATEIAGLRVPQGHAARAALLVCAEYADEGLFNHSVRSYFFGAAHARAGALAFDDELFFVSALLHDLGLTKPFDSHTLAFEEAGGELARVFTAGLGWSVERRDRAAEIIVLHMRDDVPAAQDVESHLLQVGTSADVSGRGLDAFDPGFTAELMRQLPRAGFGAAFLALADEQLRRKPGSAAAGMVTSGLAGRIAANPLERS
ncbi:HD domain-containing protein [Kitasatospora sp. NPDC057223]|uniref:HD domain-containing protein n=1 Tax=Kitasatospora sp. NPDC057223 TaxID=3346055 RepID=UPI003643B941